MIRVAIAGASGYVGGELIRLLLDHPNVELIAVTSEKNEGLPLGRVHPHLRGRTGLRFSKLADLKACDALLLALPHGTAASRIEQFVQLVGENGRIIDCSADFRLRSAANYKEWYGEAHPAPEWLPQFVYGLPECNRERLVGARFASGVGCNATAIQLALLPLERAGLLSRNHPVIAEVKVGSSEGGASAGPASHHPIRSGCVRSYAPTGHRHAAEVEQTFIGLDLHLSITAVEMVRGALATCHLQVGPEVDERTVLRAYANFCSAEPFVELIHDRAGLYRHPEPKLVAGTNRAQVGFAIDSTRGHLVALSAIDNLGKGAAGTAVQTLNLMCGFPENTALTAFGYHPV